MKAAYVMTHRVVTVLSGADYFFGFRRLVRTGSGAAAPER